MWIKSVVVSWPKAIKMWLFAELWLFFVRFWIFLPFIFLPSLLFHRWWVNKLCLIYFVRPTICSVKTRMKISWHGCRINTGWFPKWALEVQEVFPSENFLDFNSVKSSFLSFWVIQAGNWPVPFSVDEALQISGLFHQDQFIYYT